MPQRHGACTFSQWDHAPNDAAGGVVDANGLLGNEPDLNRHTGSTVRKTGDVGDTKRRLNGFADLPQRLHDDVRGHWAISSRIVYIGGPAGTSTPATARGASGATTRNPHGMQAIASSGFPHAFWPQPEQVNFVFELGAFCSLGRCALSRLSLQFVAASRS